MKENVKKIGSLVLIFPRLNGYLKHDINRDIFNYTCFFIDDIDILVTALVQNPFGRTKNLEEIKKNFGTKVCRHLQTLNRLQSTDTSIIRSHKKYNKAITLFLCNFIILFENKNVAPNYFNLKRINYAMELLETCDIYKIKKKLEDAFFSFLKPETYGYYFSLLKSTQEIYNARDEEIRKKFEKLLFDGGIRAQVFIRIKTIYSVYKKITKKNLLLPQILDSIGLRFIVRSEEDCYRAMEIIIRTQKVIPNKVKDYIALPKENGYQSLHLTILDVGHPIEIQIRTEAMHEFSQFGRAAHLYYKKN